MYKNIYTKKGILKMSISLNKVIIIGNLTADPILETTMSGVAVTKVNVAVARDFVKEENAVKADFFRVVAWRERAEKLSKFFKKGQPVMVVGRLENSQFTANDGSVRHITEIIADEIRFASTKSNTDSAQVHKQADTKEQKDINLTQMGNEEDLPF